MAESPSMLAPPRKVKVSKMSKKPMYMVLIVGILLFGVLVYSVNFAHNPEEEQAENRIQIKETEKPLLMGEGTGLSLVPPKEAVVVPAPAPAPARQEPLIVVQPAPVAVSPVNTEEIEHLRRMRSQAYLSGLSAPLTVKAASSEDKAQDQQALLDALAANNKRDFPYPSTDIPPTTSYDPEADKDKEAFFARATKDTDWIAPHQRTAGQPFELKTGSVIPAAMVTGVNSDLPGSLIAQVTQTVFDTASGRHILIPQGSKLYGVYDSRVIFGQSRVLVAWNRIVFPDGSAITLGAMPGSDMAGYAGFEDKVDNHYLRTFGSALLMSLIMGGTSYAMDMAAPEGDQISMQSEMISALASQFGQTTATLLEKNLSIKPTLEIRPGYQFNVVLTQDLVFPQPYRPWRK